MPWWLTLRYLRERTGRFRLRHVALGYVVFLAHLTIVAAQVVLGVPLLLLDLVRGRS